MQIDVIIGFYKNKDFTFGGFLRTNSDFVLISRLAFVESDENTFELCGYWCRKKYQNQGYMKEAVEKILLFAFQELKAKQILIKHASENHASKSVIEHLGFKLNKIIENGHKLSDGSFQDELIYILECPFVSDKE